MKYLIAAFKWLFDIPGRCDECNGRNKIAHGPTFSFEYCPACQKRH